MRLEMGIWLALSILFAAVAIISKWFRIPQPKWLLWLFQGFAVLATLVVFLMVVGSRRTEPPDTDLGYGIQSEKTRLRPGFLVSFHSAIMTGMDAGGCPHRIRLGLAC